MSVSFVDGVWRIVDEDRAVALHGRDPQREADRIAAQLLEGGETDLVVAIGLGLGFLLDALERRHWTGRVVAIEPEPQTVPLLRERRDWAPWTSTDRIRILAGPAFEGATECWTWFGDGLAEPRVWVHPVLERIRPAEVTAARAILRRIVFDARSNAEAKRRHGARYLANTLQNLSAIAREPGVSRLGDAIPGRPAVIVAAGPSLDATIPVLKQIEGKALIIAVDTALRPLLAAGIRPHAVVAVDPSEANARHLTDLPAAPETFLVSEGSIDPVVTAAFRGRTYFFAVSNHEPWPWLQALKVEAGRLRAWGSVLTSAFDLVLNMGADPVVFVGADLSYPEDRPYARGVSFEETWRSRARFGEPHEQQWREAIDQWPVVHETDVSGAPVRTAPHLITFRDWLVAQMQQHPGRRFVNAGGAGILRGAHLEQVAPEELNALLTSLDAPPLVHPFRERYRERDGASVREEMRQLAARADGGESDVAVFKDWQAFAPLFSIGHIARALHAALARFDAETALPIVRAPHDPGARHRVETDVQALQEVAAAVPLVPLAMAPHRLDAHATGARVFRFRTTAAAVIACALRPLQNGVTEDGVPLTRVYSLELLAPGTYALYRDQVLFRAIDGTDPRTNGRTYAVLVPPSVVYLEALPLQDVLDRDI
jgi:hypothetical protein